MSAFLPLLLLALGADAAAESRFPGTTEVFHGTFEQSDDNYAGWPERWTRRHGPGFPLYLRIHTDDQSPPGGGRCLQVSLDGGAATVYSPLIDASPAFSYVLDGYVRFERLKHDRVCLSLIYLDGAQRRLGETFSDSLPAAESWQKIRLGPATIAPGTKHLLIGLHVLTPKDGEDLHGVIRFGDIWLGRFPQMALNVRSSGVRTPPAEYMFAQPKDVEAVCTTSGFDAARHSLVFRLEDGTGKSLAESEQPLAAPLQDQTAAENLVGVNTWQPPIHEPGFYRVRATIKPVINKKSPAVQDMSYVPFSRTFTLVIIDPQTKPLEGEFGWTLSDSDLTIPHNRLSDVLCQAGLRWLKYPLLCGEGIKPPAIEPLVAFCDRLNSRGITVVGMVHPPAGGPWAAEIFALDKKTWYDPIQTVQSRLGTQIRAWQLGDDNDRGWIGAIDAAATAARVKRELDRIGYNVQTGIIGDWKTPIPSASKSLPAAGTGQFMGQLRPVSNSTTNSATKPATQSPPPWSFASFLTPAKMSAAELGRRLDSVAQPGVRRWITIEPLSASDHGAAERVDNLVRRMIAAKMHGAEGIFIARPLDAEHGLVQPDGMPTELFLPWRTTSMALSAGAYQGTIDLAGGSTLHCFGRKGQMTGVIWSRKPVEEIACLGDSLRQMDVWGVSRPCKPVTVGSGARPLDCGDNWAAIAVGRTPTFLTGLNASIVGWQLSTSFVQDLLPSIVQGAHADVLTMTNHFPQSVRGKLTIHTPPHWQIDPAVTEFRLAKGETWKLPLEIHLPGNATIGSNQIRIDFDVHADREYRFTACRSIEIGQSDVKLAVSTHLDRNGDLVITQTFTNNGTRPVSFRCDLLVPDRRRQSVEINAMPPGSDQQVYRLPRGRELLGKSLWLRAEESDGPRVLNHPFVAADTTALAPASFSGPSEGL